MIFVFEMVGWGTYHAAGNACLLQTIATAYPNEAIRFHADPSHILEVAALCSGNTNCIEFLPVPLSTDYRGRPHIVSWRRMRREFANIFQALRHGTDEKSLVVISTSTSTSVFAAAFCTRLLLPNCKGIQVLVHGELNQIRTARTRNPINRRFDMVSSFRAKRALPTRFVVLEESMRDAWIGVMPEMAGRIDVLPHYIRTDTAARAVAPAPPLRLGLVGLGTVSKGFVEFLNVAKRMKSKHGNDVAFHHVGSVPVGKRLYDLSILEDKPQSNALSSELYDDRLSSLHYVFLPLTGDYYLLSASGAILDAIEHEKPVILRRIPLSESYFEKYGDIGYLFETEEELNGALENALAAYGTERYLMQIENLKKIKATRSIVRSAFEYRRLVNNNMEF